MREHFENRTMNDLKCTLNLKFDIKDSQMSSCSKLSKKSDQNAMPSIILHFYLMKKDSTYSPMLSIILVLSILFIKSKILNLFFFYLFFEREQSSISPKTKVQKL